MKFLKSAQNVAGTVGGFGRGPAPTDAVPPWIRPTVPLVKIETKRPSLLETRAQAALRREVGDTVGKMANDYLDTLKLPLRIATDRSNALEAQTGHLESLHQNMLAAEKQARVDHKTATSEHKKELATLLEKVKEVEKTGEVLTSLEAEKARLIAQQRSIASDIKAFGLIEIDLSEAQSKLPRRPNGHEVREAVKKYDSLVLALGAAKLNLQDWEQSLTQAQEKLDQAKQQMRNARRFSKERATCGAEVLQCRKVRNDARRQVEYQRDLAERLKGDVQISSEHATDLESQQRGFSQATIRSSKQTVSQDLEAANAALERVGNSLDECLRKLPAALKEHEDAEWAEVVQRIKVDNADKAVKTACKRAEGFKREIESIGPLKNALEKDVVLASAHSKALKGKEARRSAERIENLVNSPPGFERGQITDELKTKIRALVESRLSKVPGDLKAEEVADYRLNRISDEHALEIVSRCLAHAVKGNGDDAVKALDDLMGREFADLVPAAGHDFKGKPMSHGNPQDDTTHAKRFAALIAARPSGLELLMRTAKPAPTKPSRQLQDAVNVYFRATTALGSESRPEDEDDVKWLQSAEQAAKLLVHGKEDKSGPIKTSTPVAMEDLSLDHRVAFNGVRNGYMSIADGSDYDLANKSLKKIEEWVKGAKEHSKVTSPLHTRQMVAAVSAEAGLPTLENKLSKALGIACEELLKKSGSQLLLARAHATKARLSSTSPGELPKVPRALLEAHTLLQRIQARAQKGERLDTMTLGRNDWSSIEKAVQELQQVETARVPEIVGTRGGNGLEKRNHLLEKAPNVNLERWTVDKPKVQLAPPLDPQRFSVGSLREQLGKSLDMLQVLVQLNELLTDDQAAASDTVLPPPPSPEPQPSLTRTASLAPVVEGEEEEESILVSTGTPTRSSSSDDLSERPKINEMPTRYRGWKELINEVDWNDRLKPAGAGGAVNSQADPIDQESLSLKQRLANLRVSGDGVAKSQSVPLDQRLGELNAERIKANLTGAFEPGLADIKASLVGAKSADADQTSAQLNAPRFGKTDGTKEVPQTKLSEALKLASELQTITNNFASKDGNFSEEELVQWLCSVISDNTFGNVSFNQGRLFTVGTGFLLGAFIELAGKLGLVLRPDGSYSDGNNSQLEVKRDSLGTQLTIGEQRIRTGTLALSASVFSSPTGGHSPDGFAFGPVGRLTHSRTSVNTTSGLAMRNPKFDGKTHDDLTVDFGEMVRTTIKWRSLKNNEEKPEPYKGPMEALLDLDSAISIATVEKSKSVTWSGSSFAGVFAGKIANEDKASGFGGAGGGIVFNRDRVHGEFKTNGGTQGFAGGLDSRTHTTQADAFAGVRIGLEPGSSFERLAGIRLPVAGFNSALDVRRTSAASSYATVTFPDGRVVGTRSVEYSSYEKFEAAANRHREKWIQVGIKAGDKAETWPDTYSESDKRIVSEATFNEFMANAKESLKYGTVTLNENCDVTQEVCALLTANLALEELAHLEGRMVDVAALRIAREKLLQDDSSYVPFFLKAYIQSEYSEKSSVVLPFGVQITKDSRANKVFDWFPRVDEREDLFKSLSKSQVDSSSPTQGDSRSEATKPAGVRLDVNGSQASNPPSPELRSTPPSRPTIARVEGTRNLNSQRRLPSNFSTANSSGAAANSAKTPASLPFLLDTRVTIPPEWNNKKLGLREVRHLLVGKADADGDCLFHSVIEVARPVLAEHLGCKESELTPDLVRRHVGEHVIRVLSNDGSDPSTGGGGGGLNDLEELRSVYGAIFNVDPPEEDNVENEDRTKPKSQDEKKLVSVSSSAQTAFNTLTPIEKQHIATVLTRGGYGGIASEAMPRLLADAFPGLKLVVHDARDTSANLTEAKTHYRKPEAVSGKPQRTLPPVFNLYLSSENGSPHYDPAYIKNKHRYERVEI